MDQKKLNDSTVDWVESIDVLTYWRQFTTIDDNWRIDVLTTMPFGLPESVFELGLRKNIQDLAPSSRISAYVKE